MPCKREEDQCLMVINLPLHCFLLDLMALPQIPLQTVLLIYHRQFSSLSHLMVDSSHHRLSLILSEEYLLFREECFPYLIVFFLKIIVLSLCVLLYSVPLVGFSTHVPLFVL